MAVFYLTLPNLHIIPWKLTTWEPSLANIHIYDQLIQANLTMHWNGGCAALCEMMTWRRSNYHLWGCNRKSLPTVECTKYITPWILRSVWYLISHSTISIKAGLRGILTRDTETCRNCHATVTTVHRRIQWGKFKEIRCWFRNRIAPFQRIVCWQTWSLAFTFILHAVAETQTFFHPSEFLFRVALYDILTFFLEDDFLQQCRYKTYQWHKRLLKCGNYLYVPQLEVRSRVKKFPAWPTF